MRLWLLTMAMMPLLLIAGDAYSPPIMQVGRETVVMEQGVVEDAPSPLILPAAIAQLPKPAVQPTRLSIPAEAVELALADAIDVQKSDPLGLLFTRWVWVQSGEVDDFKAVSDTFNKISRGEVTVRPIVRGILARVDLRWYARSEQDLNDWLGFWEQLQFDPWFSILITKDMLGSLSQEFKLNTTVQKFDIDWKWDANKKEWVNSGRKLVDVRVADLKDIVVVRGNAPHLRNSGIEKLQFACNTIAPIVDSRYFIGRALSTVKDKDNGKDNLFSTVWGGLYYDFSGIRTATKGVKSDFDQLLLDLETGIKEGESFKDFFLRKSGAEAAGISSSGVTGKRRRIIWFPIGKMRLSQGMPAIFITEDVKEKDVDIGNDPLMNLVTFKAAAYEVIFTKTNGQQGYALFDDVGKLLEFADGNEVVSDHTIPSPFVTKLQSGISCIRCHGPHDGWQPFANDVKTLLSERKPNGQPPLDVFGDTSKSELNKPISDTLLKLAGQYEGNPTVLMMRLRDDYAKAVLQATGSWKDDEGQINTIKLSSSRISVIWAQDRYNLIDAGLALRYLGVPKPEKGKEVETLKSLLPPVKLNVGGIVPEDPRIGLLKGGLKISPRDFGYIYPFALSRVQQTMRENKK